MYQVVPPTAPTFESTGTITVPSNWPQNPTWGTTTITYPPTTPSTLGDYEVNIEQVQNGFIVTAKNHVLVAVDMVQLTDVLTKFFNGEYE